MLSRTRVLSPVWRILVSCWFQITMVLETFVKCAIWMGSLWNPLKPPHPTSDALVVTLMKWTQSNFKSCWNGSGIDWDYGIAQSLSLDGDGREAELSYDFGNNRDGIGIKQGWKGSDRNPGGEARWEACCAVALSCCSFDELLQKQRVFQDVSQQVNIKAI